MMPRMKLPEFGTRARLKVCRKRGRVQAAYLHIGKGQVAKTIPLDDHEDILLDIDEKKTLLGVEILDPALVKRVIASKESKIRPLSRIDLLNVIGKLVGRKTILYFTKGKSTFTLPLA